MLPIKVGIVAGEGLIGELRASLKDLSVEIAFEDQEVESAESLLAKVDAAGPQVLFLELCHLKGASELIRRVRSVQHAPAVFALHTQAEPAAILEALRAGVSEYLVPPFGEALEAALERVRAESQPKSETLRRGSKILGFVSAKGGCGATTIASHIARELPKITSGKALITDCDFDAGLISFLFKTKSSYSIADAAMNVHRLDSSYWKAVVSNGIPGLEMIGAPAGASMQAFTPERIDRVFRFFRTHYDWVVADLGRGINPFRMLTLTACDEIYLVTTTEITALHHAQKAVSRILESGYSSEKLRILINKPPKQFDVTMDELEKMLGADIFARIPNDTEVLNDSYAEGTLAPPASAIGRSITELAQKIAGVQVEKTKKRFSLFG